MRREAAVAVASIDEMGEFSTDGEPVTSASRRRIHLLAALFAALAFVVVQLALAENGSAGTGVLCLKTGMETVATDAADYPPGSTVHITGTGYAPGCDAQISIFRPDTVVETFTATSDLFGNLAYDYLLPGPPGVIGDYGLEVRGYADVLLASMAFTDANNDTHVAPGWAATNSTVTFSSLYRKTTGGTVQHVRITLPVGYTNVSVPATAFSSGTWGTPVIGPALTTGPTSGQHGPTIDVSLTAGTGLATNNVDWSRIDVTATTPPANQNGNAAEWLMQTFTDTAGTAGEQNDNPPVLIGDITSPSATITFVDAGNNAISNPVFQNGVAATVRVRVTSVGSGIKYTDVAVPTCFSSPTGVTTTVSTGGTGGYSPTVIDGFIRLPGGTIPTNGFLTVQFTTTPNCTSGLYVITSDPSTNASNPPSGTNQSVSTSGGSLTVAAGKADLSITKTDSPDPVAINGTLTYTIDVSNAGPDDASAVKVVDTLPAGVGFVSATGTNWTCNNASGTVTCNRTGGNLPPGAAPDITITATAPASAGSITNSATVSSPNDDTPGNNTATATTSVQVADLSITKTDSPDPVQTNGNLTYTINVTNNSATVPATSLSVTDTIPGATTFISASGSGWTCSGTSTVTCTRPSLAAGTSASFDIVVKAPGTAATLSNTASVSSPSDNITGNNSATATTTVTANRAPSLTAPTFSPASPKTNDNLTASTTTSDPDGDQVSVAWTWKVNRAGDTCTVKTDSSALAAAGSRSVSLDLSQNYVPTSCTGPMINPLNPSKNDIVIVEATPTDAPGATGAMQSSSVAIANTAPTVGLVTAPSSANEDETKTYTFTTFDADGDSLSFAAGSPSCGTGGVLVGSPTVAGGSFQCSFPDGPASPTVSVQVSDGTASSNSATQPVSVNNVAPSIAISGAASVNEGSPYSLTLGAITDPGADTVTSWIVHWGDGNSNTYSSGGVQTHTYADGPNTYAITVDLVDEDGTFLDRANALSVTVNNVAPTIAISGAASVNEGSPYSLTLGAVTDPGSDTVSSYVVHWGDGSSDTYATAGAKSHTYAEGPNDYDITVDLVDEDGTFLDRANDLSVHVNNVAPTVTLSAGNALDVNEGSTHTYSYTISDPGQDTITSVATSCGANGTKSNASNTNTAGSFDCTFPDGDSGSTVSAQATDSDTDTGNLATQTVTIHNVAPIVTLSATNDLSVDEGTTHAYSYTVGDPGQDTFTVDATYPKCGLHGTLVGTPTTTATGGSFQCNFPDGPNSSTVAIKVTDSDGASDSASQAVQVVAIANVAPSVTAAADQSSNEGESHSFSLGSFSDPGDDSPWHVSVNWGDGSPATTFDMNAGGTITAQSHTYADGPNLYTVTVSVNDGDDTTSKTFKVTVNNVAPSIAISGAASVNEGSPYSLTLGAVTDPGTDTVSSYIVHWGDGNSDTYTTAGAKSHTYADGPATRSITVDLVDEDGTFLDRANALSVTVNNVAPTVTFTTAPATADEGDTKTYIYSVTDPGVDTFTVDATYPKCGLHGTLVGTPTVTASGGSFQCNFPDGPNSSTVAIKVTDSDGASDTASQAVQVVAIANVAPNVTTPANQSSDEGESHSFSLGSFTDPGDDSPWTVTVDWGDGTFPLTTFQMGASGTITAQSHTYADGPNDYTVIVSVNDGDDSTSKTFSVHVNNVAPSIAISGNANVNEGSPYSLTLGAVTDPGSDTVSSYVVHWGDGSSDSYGTNGVKTHTYADGPNDYDITVDLVDEDGTFLDRANDLSVHVNNVAPTVNVTGPASVDEGSTHTYSYTISDPGADTFALVAGYPTCGSGGNVVSGSYTISGNSGSQNGSFDCTFPDGPATTNVAIKFADSDGASATDSESVQIVNVANVAPNVVAAADQSSNEGASHSFSLGSFTDPGDDSPWSVSVNWGDGSPATTFSMNAGGTITAQSHTYADGPNLYTVTVSVNDGNDTTSKTFKVTVNNVAPSIAISGAASVNEGSPYSLTLGAVTDPGSDTVSSYIVHWGDGSSDTYATAGTKSHTYADGPNDYDITVDLVDEDGTFLDRANDLSVHVNNVAPTVAFTTAPAAANDGDTKTYTFSITDPGADTQSYATGYPSCGANGTTTGTPTITNSGGSFQCTFSGGTSSTVSVKVFDGDDNSGEASQVVAINRAPSTDAGPNASGDEGSAIALDGTVTDPEGDSITVKWTYTAGAGVDAGATCAFANDTAVDTTIKCTDDGTYTAKLESTDSKGAKSSDTTTVTVSNKAPVVTITAPAFGALYAKTATTNPTVTVNASFTDAGKNDTHTAPAGGSCTVTWDDGMPNSTGTVTETPQSGLGACTSSHVYTVPGVYTIRVTVTDDDGSAGYAETMIVVYDSSAGFVTGGGWIDVQPGSYTADPTLSGRANFGFNSQYKKGATVPTGNTEFQFQVANLNFHSEKFDWLVVSGFKSQFRGTGTINGSGNYKFTLTAYDGQVGGGGGIDRFRIVISDAVSGAVVFDNRNGASMDIDAANPQNIAGGSIVIHKA
jgi:uncharacterized repeat protein (TIGR01451 family)